MSSIGWQFIGIATIICSAILFILIQILINRYFDKYIKK